MSEKKEKLLLGACGVVTGIINGLFGGGGGIVVLFFLSNILKKQQKVAQATTLSMILPISVISAIVYLIKGNYFLPPTAFTTLGVVVGGVVGTFVLKKIPTKVLPFIFSILIIFLGFRRFF